MDSKTPTRSCTMSPIQPSANPSHQLHISSADRSVRLLFLEEANLSTGGHMDHIYDYYQTRCTARYEKITTVDAAREQIAWADVVWLEWASDLMAEVSRKVDRLRPLPDLSTVRVSQPSEKTSPHQSNSAGPHRRGTSRRDRGSAPQAVTPSRLANPPKKTALRYFAALRLSPRAASNS